MRRLLKALLASALLLAIVLYARSVVHPPAAPAPRLAVTLAVPKQPSSLLTFVALERGYFSQRGLDVSIKDYPSGKRALEEGLLAGQTDIAWTNEVPIAIAGFQRKDMRIIATMLRADNLSKIIARSDRGIVKPEDLRGKRIATQQSSAVHFFLHLFLLEHGLGERDVQLSFHKAEDLPAALASGAVDAISMREPYISQAKELLGGNAVLFEAPELYELMESMVTRADILEKQPDLVRKALQAMLDAESFAIRHPQEAAAIAARALGVDVREIEQLWPSLKIQVSLIQPLLILLEYQARWAIAARLVDQGAVPDYLELIHSGTLRQLKPEAVTLIQ